MINFSEVRNQIGGKRFLFLLVLVTIAIVVSVRGNKIRHAERQNAAAHADSITDATLSCVTAFGGGDMPVRVTTRVGHDEAEYHVFWRQKYGQIFDPVNNFCAMTVIGGCTLQEAIQLFEPPPTIDTKDEYHVEYLVGQGASQLEAKQALTAVRQDALSL